jgi:hypothetical protein
MVEEISYAVRAESNWLKDYIQSISDLGESWLDS